MGVTSISDDSRKDGIRFMLLPWNFKNAGGWAAGMGGWKSAIKGRLGQDSYEDLHFFGTSTVSIHRNLRVPSKPQCHGPYPPINHLYNIIPNTRPSATCKRWRWGGVNTLRFTVTQWRNGKLEASRLIVSLPVGGMLSDLFVPAKETRSRFRRAIFVRTNDFRQDLWKWGLLFEEAPSKTL